MQMTADETLTTHQKMAELRMTCEREIQIQRERATLAASSFRQSLHSIRSMAEETLINREKVGKLKDYLKELEADLAEILAVKTCKEAKRTVTAESLSTTVARTEQLKKIVKNQRARKDKYAGVISQQLLALNILQEKSSQDIIETKNIDEAIMWYKRVLGFRTEGGEGVKFIFSNIDLKDPDEEYSFTIRLDGDIYILLQCDLHLEDIGELIEGLNKTNDLFKFVRIMREKFQAAALNGAPICPDSFSVTVSSPPPTSVDSRSKTPIKHNDSHFLHKEVRCDPPQRVVSGQVAIPSPQSISAPHRSTRFMAKRFP